MNQNWIARPRVIPGRERLAFISPRLLHLQPPRPAPGVVGSGQDAVVDASARPAGALGSPCASLTLRSCRPQSVGPPPRPSIMIGDFRCPGFLVPERLRVGRDTAVPRPFHNIEPSSTGITTPPFPPTNRDRHENTNFPRATTVVVPSDYPNIILSRFSPARCTQDGPGTVLLLGRL